MAKATKHVAPPVEPEYTLTLELSQKEAEALASVLERTEFGSPAQSIFDALIFANVRRSYSISTFIIGWSKK